MKVNRALAARLLPTLAKGAGLSFKYSDRLTQQETAALDRWARSQPYVVEAYMNKGHPENRQARLYVDLVRHFMMDHPQGQDGEPAPWPDPATAERPIGENIYGVKTAEEAEALLIWAEAEQEYRAAYDNKDHPQHALYVEQTLGLRELVAPPSPVADGGQAAFEVAAGRTPAATAAGAEASPSAAASRGLTPAQIAERAQMDRDGTWPKARIRELQKHPAYLDAKHPEHAQVKGKVTEAYQAAYPEPAEAGGTAAPPAAPAA